MHARFAKSRGSSGGSSDSKTAVVSGGGETPPGKGQGPRSWYSAAMSQAGTGDGTMSQEEKGEEMVAQAV